MVLLLRTLHRFLFHLPLRWLQDEVFCIRKFYLAAVINHSGNMNCGNYTCLIKYGDTPWHCNDKALVRVNLDDINKSLPYVLFYQTKYFFM